MSKIHCLLLYLICYQLCTIPKS